MRRVVRHFFTTISALSLVLCLTICVLWVRSYWRVTGAAADLFKNTQIRGESGIWTTNGRIVLDTARHLDVSRWATAGWKFSDERRTNSVQFVDARGAVRWQCLGFKVAQSISPSGDGTRFEMAAIAVPFWAIVAITAVLPLLKIGRTIAKQRARVAGLCPVCGYDLRASPDRCPECGTLARNG